MKQVIQLAQDGSTGIQGVTGVQGVQGVTGLQGQAADVMHFRGSIQVNGDFIDILDRENGDFYTVTGATVYDAATDQTFVQGDEIVWSGTSSLWVLVGNMPSVVQGATGVQGTQGETGASGTEGAQGATGLGGLQGVTGLAGLAGDQGATGTQGAQGETGAAGGVGATGLQGVTGLAGVEGSQGATGLAGEAGDQGATGAQGATGLAGSDGDQGATGTQGIQGVTGAQGLAADVMRFKGALATSLDFPALIERQNGDFYTVTGASVTDSLVTPEQTFVEGDEIIWSEDQTKWVQVGSALVLAQGATGVQGQTGVSGVTGLAGVDGAQGATGAAGTSGATGIQGLTGVAGVDGATGIAGIDGSTGVQGVQGVTGVQGSVGSKWAPSTIYVAGAVTFYNGIAVVALSNHTSSASFSSDLDKWESVDKHAWLGYQEAHGFSGLQAAYMDSAGAFQKAQADVEGTLASHLIMHVLTDHLLAVQSGDYDYTAHGLTGVQYCSPTVAGGLVNVQPDPETHFINPVAIATTVNKLRVVADQPAYKK